MKVKGFFQGLFNWELWPFYVLYAPIGPVWFWYCFRARSFWFFSSSNPTITFGGFEGESKREMYEQLPPDSHPKTIYVLHDLSFENVKKKICEAGFNYPFIVKPDVGMKGILFRKIESEDQLEKYHHRIPVEYIVQDLVEMPVEVSVFYYRHPTEKKGVITGFIQKELLEVYGDGKSTLWELIMVHPNARHRPDEMRIKHEQNLKAIIPKGERYILTYAANLNRGAKFSDLYQHVDDEMLKIFDEISIRTQFYYGRYDIKCQSIEDLRKKQNFTILEFNGSGAEPNHVYHAGYSLFDAYKVFLRHWKVLYEISKYNNQHGVPYWPLIKGWKFLQAAKKNLQLLEEKDKEILV